MKPLQPIAAEVPETLRQADATLHLYGRWAMHRWKPQRCGSAERYYLGERTDADFDPRREPRETLMPGHEAVKVQRALYQVPEPFRVVLQALYIPQKLPAHVLLAKKRIPPKLSRERHLEGLFMFRNSLKAG